MAVAAVNAFASEVEYVTAKDTLYGVGLGPGDPELVTVKAARLIGAADVDRLSLRAARTLDRAGHRRAVPARRADRGEARLPGDHRDDRPPGRIRGRDGRVLRASPPIGWPRISTPVATSSCSPRVIRCSSARTCTCTSDWPTVSTTRIVPGVTSVSAASAAIGTPLVEGDEVLTILPGTLSADVLAEHLRHTDAAAIMKVSRHFDAIQDALKRSGRLDDAHYVERASSRRATHRARRRRSTRTTCRTWRWCSSRALLAAGSPATCTPAPSDRASRRRRASARVGPTGSPRRRAPCWLRPTTSSATGRTSTESPRTRASSGTAATTRSKPSAPSSRSTLRLRGARVAVVSSGDPGVFAMASAVLEAAADERYATVDVGVVPGLTAAQAVASQVGAPLGHDFAVISLSDRLKPWEVVAERLEAAAASRSRDRDLQPGVGGAPPADRRRARVVVAPPCASDRRRRRTCRRFGRAAGRRHDARGPRSAEDRHALPADRRLVADPRGDSGTGRPHAGVHPAPLPSAASHAVAALDRLDRRDARRATAGGRPSRRICLSSRAAISFARVIVPPLSLVSSAITSCWRISAVSPSTVNGPRSEQQRHVAAESRLRGGSTVRTR